MPEGRPPIPAKLRRQVLVEAGHRCAIPTCGASVTEVAHIVPWHISQSHSFDNLIALCPNCHTRYDSGQIDRSSMREYKRRLASQNPILTAGVVRRMQLDAYLGYRRSLDAFEGSIGSVMMANVDSNLDHQAAAKECELAWVKNRDELARLTDYFSAHAASIAANIFSTLHSYADYAVDGLIPSTHIGRMDPDWYEVADALEKLHDLISAELELEPSEVEKFLSPSGNSLGGTGLRY